MESEKKKDKLPHPRANANLLSVSFFFWIIGTFRKGLTKELDVEDLYAPLKEHSSDYLGDKFERIWREEIKKAQKSDKPPSLLWTIIRCFGVECMSYGFIVLGMEIFFRVTQPLFLGKLIQHFEPNSDVTKQMAYCYAGAIVGCSFMCFFVRQHFMVSMFHMGMKIRIGICSLVYRKALRMSPTALGETTVGQVVNLLSNDVNRFDYGLLHLHYMWIAPLETLIVMYFMWNFVGVSAVIGMAVIILFIPLQGFLGKKTASLRLRTAIRTDERVRLMNEIISGMQVIKMYTWELPFAKLVALTRRNEIQVIRMSSYIRAIIYSFQSFMTRITLFVTILAYVLLGNYINAEKVFVVASYFNIIRLIMTDFFPRGIALLAEALISTQRVQKFLLNDEVKPNQPEVVWKEEKVQEKSVVKNGRVEDLGISMQNVTAKWSPLVSENTLTSVSLNLKPGDIVAVIGPVGAGKTSLLHAILRELPLTSGSVVVGGIVSYAAQEPWLFAASVRQNILFGQPLDARRYDRVLNVCALKRDLQLLVHGDQTIVGERGVSLSGGQRARVTLARAVYKVADIYLLDDPLSAVDSHVGRHLFEDCITGFLEDKMRILVTHQLQYLTHADQIIIINNGVIEARGTYNQLQESGLDFAKLLKDPSEEGSSGEEESSDTSFPSIRRLKKTSVGSSRSVNQDAEEQHMEAEMRSQGKVSSDVYLSYFSAGGNVCIISLLFFACFLAQVVCSGSDYWLSYWANLEAQRSSAMQLKQNNLTSVNGTAGGAESGDGGERLLSIETCIWVFCCLTIAIIVVNLYRSFHFFAVCMRASINLHDAMFQSIVRTTMRFFNTYPSGQILNRFSRDMGSIDEMLPMTILEVIEIAFVLLGVIILISIVNFWILLPTVLIFTIFYWLRVVYIATSRSIKRLDGITRSPVFSHLNASLQGLSTIRAFQAQGILEREFDSHQDLHSSAWYLFITSSRAFGLWLDVGCLFYIACVTFSFLVMGGEDFGGNVGLAITQAISITGTFQWGMRQTAEMENQMTSVERVLEYTNLEQESGLDSPPGKEPPSNWPSQGMIKFDQIYLRYSQDDPPVLKNLNFTIHSKEKIGIVGRTGAGKSSILAALFRLADVEGSVLIDGVDTASISLHRLRSKVSIIPQEPVLFSGTMRTNLDPLDEFHDSVLWNALEEVELKEAINELPHGLSSKMCQGGANLSLGQRQLVCLARAIVRNNKILVLDEATANVDPQTDSLIQYTIRCKFADCTVLTIAHRLQTVMDSDRVLVMDAGNIVVCTAPIVGNTVYWVFYLTKTPPLYGEIFYALFSSLKIFFLHSCQEILPENVELNSVLIGIMKVTLQANCVIVLFFKDS